MTARREIGKRLNEQPNCEVDRVALAERGNGNDQDKCSCG